MIKHPLVQKEWKIVRWAMLLFSLIYAFFAVILNDDMYYNKKTYLFNDNANTVFMGAIYRMSALMLPIVLIGIIILVILLFSHERNLNVGKFMSSLPFSRKEQFTIKYIMGILTFTLPLLLFGVVAYVIRISHDKWISHLYKYLAHGDIRTREDSIGALFLWLVLIWLIMLAVYSFLMLIQTLMGQNIIAGIVGGIIYLVPWFLVFAIPKNIQLIFHRYWRNSLSWSVEFFLLGSPEGTYEHIGARMPFLNWNGRGYVTYEYRYLPICIAILIGVIVISTILAYHFIQSNDVEKTGDLVMYPWVGKILVVGVTVCSLLLLPIIVQMFTQTQSSILGVVSMVIGGILGFVISTKSIELTQKHG